MSAPVLLTIGGIAYPFIEDSLNITRKTSEARRLVVTVLDYAGTLRTVPFEQITVTDAVLGTRFSGFVIDDKMDKSNVYPDPTIEHKLDCTDNTHLAKKRTSNRVYTGATPAGKIAVDMVSDVLSAEGVIAKYAAMITTTQNDWKAGTLASTIAQTQGDGDLELVASGGIVSKSYVTQSDWASGGSGSAIQLNADGSVQLIGVSRTWSDGNKSNQTLFGNGSPSDSISGGSYYLSCAKTSETRSRLDFAGTWTNGTIEVDLTVGANSLPGFTWHTTGWSNNDNTYAYVVELSTTKLAIRRGGNGSGSTSTEIASTTFSISPGVYRVRVIMTGNTYIAYVLGTSYTCLATDSTYPGAGYIALRNRNTGSSSLNQQFGNFGVMNSESGAWTSASVSVNSIATVTSSVITWDTSLSQGGTITVQTSVDGGSTYQTATSGSAIPLLGHGTSGTGKSVIVSVQFSTTSTVLIPIIRSLSWTVTAGFVASGTRNTLPLANDTMVRANQSGWGTASDMQVWAKSGTGTDAISGNEATITNTTGDVHERLGSATATDEDGSVRFQLSASALSGGIELRYTDANNFYRFSATTMTLTLSKTVASVATTLGTASQALSTGVWYRMRFRVTGSATVTLQGRVWADGTTEPTTWGVTANEVGAVVTALSVYGSSVASATLATANQLSTTTGGAETSVTEAVSTSAINYGELYSQGNAGAWASSATLPAPSGHGDILDPTTLEGQTLISGNYTPTVTLAASDGFGDTLTADIIVRLSKRTSGGVYTTIGTYTLSGQTIGTKATFALAATNTAAMAFATGDKLYRDRFLKITNNGFFANGTVTVYESNSGTAGLAEDSVVTPGYQATGSGTFLSGGYGLMANGTGVVTFDSFRVTTYPDPSLSLTPVGRVGSTSVSWNALLPTNTTLGIDISTDGVNWTDVSAQNGGPIPGITTQPDPTIDLFNTNSLANYTNAVGYNGSVAGWAIDVTNSRITATNGASGMLLYSAITAKDIDLLTDMDESDAGGLAFCVSDPADYYSIAVADDHAAIGTKNTLTLYKTVAGVQSTLATASIAFQRGTFHRIRAKVLAGAITVSFDGTLLSTSLAQDTFIRPNQSGWGTASDGEAWTLDGGVGTLAIAGNKGTVVDSGGSDYLHLGTKTAANAEGLVRMAPGNSGDFAAILLHYGSSSDFYRAYLHTGSGIGTIALEKRVGGTVTTLVQGDVGITITAGTFYWLRFQVFGVTLQARAWADGTLEPTTWQVTTNDGSQTNAGFALWAAPSGASAISFDHFTVTLLSAGGAYITAVDSTPLPAGQAGLICNAGVAAHWDLRTFTGAQDLGIPGVSSTVARFYQLWIQPQGDDLTGKYVYTRQRLATTDSTVTPQVLDLTVAAFSPNIGAGALLPTAAYQHTFCNANYDDLTKKSGDYYWTIDDTKNLIFKKRIGVPAPWILYSSSIAPAVDLEVDSTLVVEVANDQYRNRQTLLGVIGTTPFTNTFVGNSQATSFPLSYPVAPHTTPIIKLNLNQQTALPKGMSGANWYYDTLFIGDPTIAQDSSQPVLASTDTLTVTAQGAFQTTVTVDNIPAQQALAAISFDSGIVEAVEDVSARNMDVPTATAYAGSLLARFCLTGRTITFPTYRNGLDAGQLLPVFLPEEGVWNGQFFLVEVDIVELKTQPGNTVIYKYQCTATEVAYAGSWQKLLASGLLQQ